MHNPITRGITPYNYPVMFQIMQIPELVTKLGQLIFMEHTGTLIMQLFNINTTFVSYTNQAWMWRRPLFVMVKGNNIIVKVQAELIK